MKAVLYIHGKDGSPSESEFYKPIFKDCDVTGLDYKTFTPWQTGKEIYESVKKLKEKYGKIIIVANSIGAFFCMSSDIDGFVKKAYFISPVVDMESLILGMMAQANVTEAELKEKGVIGELSWEYLCYVREHPVKWDAPTHIIYGENDVLTPYETVRAFAEKHGASLAVMKGGEHWFHTDEQMDFIRSRIEKSLLPTVIETDRLTVYPATDEQIKKAIADETDPELKKAYTDMLQGCIKYPDNREWYAMWMIEQKDGTHIGDLCFKGLDGNSVSEIGYGLLEEYQGKGYATEAVKAALSWAFCQPGVTGIEAEAEENNAASQRVLFKCGFTANGKTGEEGPRFSLSKTKFTEVVMKNNIAYCGLDCEKCEAYIATKNNDNALREKVAKLWSELNNVTITPDMINCDGCRENGRKTPFCESLCRIRQCGLEKKYNTCGDCAQLESCEKVGMIIKNNAEALNNLKK